MQHPPRSKPTQTNPNHKKSLGKSENRKINPPPTRAQPHQYYGYKYTQSKPIYPSPPTSHSNIEAALAPAHQPPASPLRTTHGRVLSHFCGFGPDCLPAFASLLFSFPQYAGRRYLRTTISRPVILPVLDDARAATAPAPAPTTPPTPDLDLHAPITAPTRLHEPPEQQHRPAQQHLLELRVPGPPLATAVPGLWRRPPELELPAAHPGSAACTYAPTAPYSQAHSPPQNFSRQSYSLPQQALTYQPPPPQPPQAPHQQLHEQLHIKSETSDDTMTGRVKRERVAPAGISEDVKPHLGASQGIEIKTKFPVARIKRIMQADEEVGKVAQVTPVAVSKALELFMISLVTKSATLARSTNSKRVTAVHLKKAIEADEQFDFLNDIVSKIADGPDAGQGKRTKEEEDGSDSDEKPKKKGRRKKGE
ncbi:hypothetical protein V502_04848 [Pseudogymnoascus sp. VKM F-4520 (FW-2644)]|nr:hypothetical protein V502_04848 [Pseudogymnoascus sp. VKM F-4520 (FW-2644)]